ncbi:MAG: hypothetical protein O2961_05150 [Bacteroidetes bacterium]|nr:hypothetical protein [Bacteroidota bacterium]MDA0888847.1 hypothetical protein [Bacteroidota bacterium]
MPFNSNTARVAGQKSKRGKAKYTTEIRDKLNNLTDYLIQDLNIQDLDTNEKLALLRILLAYTLTKPKIDYEAQEQKHFTVEVIDKLA